MCRSCTALCVDLVADPCSFEPGSEVSQLAQQMRSLLETAVPADDCIQLPVSSSTEESHLQEVTAALHAAGISIGERVVVGGIKVATSFQLLV